MIDWSLVQVLVPIGLLGLLALIVRARSRRPARWEVQVRSAQCYEADCWDGRAKITPVRGEVAVRVVFGKRFLTIGTLAVDAEQFEEELAELRALAEERAALLNAHGVIS